MRVPVFIAAALTACLAVCAPGTSRGAQLFTTLDFQFEDGSVLPDVHIAYETHGTLSPARDNAILLIPGAIGDRHVFDWAIGSGKIFDTDKYFVIAVDPIGGGESSSPAEGMGQDFPRYTIRDMMETLYALASREFGVSRLRALAGLSMGSFIALDPEWQGGRYSRNPVEGLRHAGMLFYPWLVSAAYLDRISPQRLAKELEATARTFAEWDANALVLRYAAYRGHDVSAPYDGDMVAALSQVTAPTLALASASDRLVGIEGARRVADGVKQGRYAEIPTDLGHRALRAPPDSTEAGFLDRQLRPFLAAPGGRGK